MVRGIGEAAAAEYRQLAAWRRMLAHCLTTVRIVPDQHVIELSLDNSIAPNLRMDYYASIPGRSIS